MSLGQRPPILFFASWFCSRNTPGGLAHPVRSAKPNTSQTTQVIYANFVVVNHVEGLKPALGLRVTRLHVSNLPKAASPVDHRFPVLLIRR
jgi:hypothetical protein